MSSEPHRQLSVNLPPSHWRLDVPETSRYSQSFTIGPSSRFSFDHSNKHSNPISPSDDIEEGASQMSSNQRERFSRLYSDVWMLNGGGPDPSDPRLSQWRPLRVEQRRLEERHRSRQPYDLDHGARIWNRKRRLWYILTFLILLILLLIGNVIFLNVRVLSHSATTGQIAPTTNSTTNALSADAQQCLSQYTDTPSTPRNYPCSTCPSVLLAVPPSYTSSSAHTQNTQLINSVVQFCSLRTIYETTSIQGQATLGNGSWIQNVNFCTWAGVGCDLSGQVSSLQLTYPGVPASLPDEIGRLTALRTLQIIGGNATPAGSLPGSFTNLTSLTALHLEATSITALPNSLFASPGLTRLSNLSLIHNSQMGSSLPNSLTSLAGLQNLSVNSQELSESLLATLAQSPSLAASLHILDLTSTSLTCSIPSTLSSFKNLDQLLLGSNNLTGTVPTFPSTLQVLELNGNAELDGSIVCTSTSLARCSVQGTAISVADCNVCQNTTV